MTLRPKKSSESEASVTVTTFPSGFTSSNAVIVSIASPYWLVFHEYPNTMSCILALKDAIYSPPPRTKPPTPIPVTRPPNTLTLCGAKAAYTSSNINPVPMAAVWDTGSYLTSLNRYKAINTPLDEEKLRFVAWPPLFICYRPRKHSVKRQMNTIVRRMECASGLRFAAGVWDQVISEMMEVRRTILPTSSTVPGSTVHIDFWVLDDAQ